MVVIIANKTSFEQTYKGKLQEKSSLCPKVYNQRIFSGKETLNEHLHKVCLPEIDNKARQHLTELTAMADDAHETFRQVEEKGEIIEKLRQETADSAAVAVEKATEAELSAAAAAVSSAAAQTAKETAVSSAAEAIASAQKGEAALAETLSSESRSKISEENAREYAANVNPENLLHTYQLTNCIMEIPQNIKMELSTDGILTVKSGSKIYIPNTDGEFAEITLTEDLSIDGTTINGTECIFITADGTNIICCAAENCSSGEDWSAENENTVRYNTAENQIKSTNDNAVSWRESLSLPIAVVSRQEENNLSVSYLFNGFGYIGSTVFVLPDVKFLAPNGRKKNSTLNNLECITTSVYHKTLSGSQILKWAVCQDGSLECFNDYQSSEYCPSCNSVLWYHPDENKLYNVSAEETSCILGTYAFETESKEGQITSFLTAKTFQAVDYKDFSSLSASVMHISGDERVQGTKTFVSPPKIVNDNADNSIVYQDTAADYTQTPSVLRVKAFRVNDKNNKILGDVRIVQNPNGFNQTALMARRGIDGTEVSCNITANVSSSGEVFVTHPSARSSHLTSSVSTDSATIGNVNTRILSVLNSLYPVGSFYLTVSDNCPLQELISGSTWEKTDGYLLTSSTVPVIGNGMTIGLTTGSAEGGLGVITRSIAANGYGLMNARTQSLGTAAGSSNTNTSGIVATNVTYGLSTNPDVSGLIASVNNKSLKVNIFRRVA